MKIKIGTVVEEIKSMENYVFADESVENGGERLSIRLINDQVDIRELSERIKSAFKGAVTFIDDDDTEEIYSGFTFTGVRKSYEITTRMVMIDLFKKAAQAE